MEIQRRICWEADKAERGTKAVKLHPSGNDAASDTVVAAAINEAGAGSADAVRFLYLRYADSVKAYVRTLIRDQHEAEDVTQQVFIKMMNSVDRYQPRGVPFAAWLIRIARNTAIDHLRDNRQVPCAEVPPRPQSDEDLLHHRRQDLVTALGRLPQEQRNVVVLRHLGGFSPGEIGLRMGRSEASVHGLHHRGRQALRQELARLEAAPAAMGRAA